MAPSAGFRKYGAWERGYQSRVDGGDPTANTQSKQFLNTHACPAHTEPFTVTGLCRPHSNPMELVLSPLYN